MLEVFNNLFMFIAEEMGLVLSECGRFRQYQRTS